MYDLHCHHFRLLITSITYRSCVILILLTTCFFINESMVSIKLIISVIFLSIFSLLLVLTSLKLFLLESQLKNALEHQTAKLTLVLCRAAQLSMPLTTTTATATLPLTAPLPVTALSSASTLLPPPSFSTSVLTSSTLTPLLSSTTLYSAPTPTPFQSDRNVRTSSTTTGTYTGTGVSTGTYGGVSTGTGVGDNGVLNKGLLEEKESQLVAARTQINIMAEQVTSPPSFLSIVLSCLLSSHFLSFPLFTSLSLSPLFYYSYHSSHLVYFTQQLFRQLLLLITFISFHDPLHSSLSIPLPSPHLRSLFLNFALTKFFVFYDIHLLFLPSFLSTNFLNFSYSPSSSPPE